VLPTEHGGWGFLLEPLVLGLAVAPSFAGFLIAVAAILGFLTRQPLKLAMQDALRGKTYPRTRWCRIFAVGYATGALCALALAVTVASPASLLPFALVAPLAAVTLVFDARNRSRAPFPEYAGAVAMGSTAAAIAIAGGLSLTASFALMALIALRGIPAIVYVRTLLRRAHKQAVASWPALAAHATAIPLAWLVSGSWLATAATTALMGRAVWGLAHPPVAARTIGWREIAWGALTVAMFAIAMR
jgi:hypothetical protein